LFRMYRRAAVRKAGCVALAVVMAMSMLAGLMPVAAGAVVKASLPGSTPLNGVYFWLGTNPVITSENFDSSGKAAADAADDYLQTNVTAQVYSNIFPASGLPVPADFVTNYNSGDWVAAGTKVAQFFQDVSCLGFATENPTSSTTGHDPLSIAGNIASRLSEDETTLKDLLAGTTGFTPDSLGYVGDYYRYLLAVQDTGIPITHSSDLTSVFTGSAYNDQQWLADGMTNVGTSSGTAQDKALYGALEQINWLNTEMAAAQVGADRTAPTGSDAEAAMIRAYVRSRAHFTVASQNLGGEESFSVSENGNSGQGQIEIVLSTGDIPVTSLLPDWTSTNANVTPNWTSTGLSVAGGSSTTTNTEITGYVNDPVEVPYSWIYKGLVNVTAPGPGPGPNPGPNPTPAVANVSAVGAPPPGAMIWPYTLIKNGEESFNFTKGINYQFNATGGTGPYTWAYVPGPGQQGTFTWSAVPGTMPKGLTLSSGGLLTGTPQTLKSIGYSLLNLNVTDSTGTSYSMAAKLFIAAFPDIIDDWAVNDIDQLTVSGVTYGYPDHMFWPKNDITRGEFAQMLVLSQGIKPSSDYSDLMQFADYASIPKWDKPYLAAAVAHGLMFGYGQNTAGQYIMAANKDISREEMAATIGRAFQGVTPADLNHFTDGSQVHNWQHNFREDVAIALAKGVIKGFPDSSFKPFDYTLRDQAAAMITRWMGIADPNE